MAADTETSRLFNEIDTQLSSLGEISLRCRRIPAFGDRDIYEVKLGDEFLMSSMFVEAEIALAELALSAVSGDDLKVVVGGLGLGYTAEAALRDSRISQLLVIEALCPVIHWHRAELVPLGKVLNADTRCDFIHGDFFALAAGEGIGFHPRQPDRLFDAILLDIDHSPRDYLSAHHGQFYTNANLAKMAGQLRDGGVFAMWSNEPPDTIFMSILRSVFGEADAQVVRFYNPLQNNEAANTVYLARKASA